tara:strand:- start:230 stop:1309 length:1080 start_codon:yes stop_codon:yes gene_type:complete
MNKILSFEDTNHLRFESFKNIINTSFPALTQKVDFDEISTILILQIKGSDVHPKGRHPDFFYQHDHPKVLAGEKTLGQPINKKTQIDITAPLNLPTEQSPVTSLVTPGPETAKHHPIELFHPIDKKWVTKLMKIQPKVEVANGPAPDQARLLIGGTDSGSWSSELWANMGHYRLDKWGHIIFVRSGSGTPLCFTIPKNILLEELLLDGGKRRGESYRFRHLTGSPLKKSLVIVGPKPIDKSLSLEYMYIVTHADQEGWVKIGKTTQEDPKNRLRQYNQGPVVFDMNYIFATSNCHKAEKEVMKRLDQLGVNKRANEWYNLGALHPAISVIREVIKLYPPPVKIDLKPILFSKESWAYDN